jgi:hypothetical protein
MAIYSYSNGASKANVDINISGGIFNGDVALGGGNKTAYENASITGGTFNSIDGAYTWDENAPGFISGGIFVADVSEYLAEGYEIVANEDGTFGVKEKATEPEYELFDTELYYMIFDKIQKDANGKDCLQLIMIAGIDSLKYQEVGFIVQPEGEEGRAKASTKAYRKLTVQTKNGTEDLLPNMFSDDAQYLFYYSISMPTSFDDTKINVTPYAIRNDGTEIRARKTAEINDIYNP